MTRIITKRVLISSLLYPYEIVFSGSGLKVVLYNAAVDVGKDGVVAFNVDLLARSLQEEGLLVVGSGGKKCGFHPLPEPFRGVSFVRTDIFREFARMRYSLRRTISKDEDAGLNGCARLLLDITLAEGTADPPGVEPQCLGVEGNVYAAVPEFLLGIRR